MILQNLDYICATDCTITVNVNKKKTTIYDIAKALKITPSTVSRALSDHPRISVKTKAAVRSKAASLNYQHNGIAAALRSGQTNIIGVIVPTANRSFFSSVVKGIEDVAKEAGYNVMITQSNDDEQQEQSNLKALMKAQVDGIILSIGKETRDLTHLKEVVSNRIPLIMFDRAVDIPEASTVVIDDFLGAYKAVEHLILQGCKRIAHFAGPSHVNIYRQRLNGYKEALRTHNIEVDEQLILTSNMKIKDGRIGMEKLLQLENRPDAVFAASDYAVVGAMQLLKEKNVQIPAEIALVGFADELFTSLVDPGLTSVNQRCEQMGQLAARIFIEQVTTEGDDFIPRKTVLTPELIVRASSIKRD